ncbi:MAG: phosphoadenylyl-sulfate reductase [Ferruginibacter sp.]|nr:phosphoadenylyl-sulfate reductase [Ferruginibacter sp.]
MNIPDLEPLKTISSQFSIDETLQYLVNNYQNSVCFSTSFGQEDQVITNIIARNKLALNIFTIDTGRMFQETYDVYQNTIEKYGINIVTYFPEATNLEKLVSEKGPNSFYNSVENRKECCLIRKVLPLTKALQGMSIWITGLRAAQSESRNDLQLFEYDFKYKVIKYNPLLQWTLEEVETYLQKNNVPQSSLHKRGFVSIGCAPCTRAIEKGEDIRAGRWWWETSHKECGLHQK